ncbi:MAG TPA: [Fe-Fe] hydrogenase large subunit C-terminal domain-containing protein [Candidatus Bathyarchaeia archaeon]|nr:[Fe-Fe] hydrogenase large subunit C-terminal domain-containing protein [Candidatus Bathyarchaeia archaeon]
MPRKRSKQDGGAGVSPANSGAVGSRSRATENGGAGVSPASFQHVINGGDYDSGGDGAKRIKDVLKKIGVDPQLVRRTMVAAYEAEMNVVIHAYKGLMKVAIDPAQVDVAVIDEGPGIPDVDLAMKEGYSTAPPAARELGFGAGLGLPNIKKNSDRFSLQSVPGQGTRLRFTVLLQPQQAAGPARNSVQIDAEKCRQCLMCVHACPTQAVRVQSGRPRVLDHLCIDCTSCLAACDAGAMTMPSQHRVPPPTPKTVLVIPGSFLEQFGPGVSPGQVIGALRDAGFSDIRLLDEWENALRDAVAAYARDEAIAKPAISPACPAVINLIQVRFPSLLAHLAPFLTPAEAAREEITAPHAVWAAPCPAQCTILRAPSLLTRIDLVDPLALRQKAFEHIGVHARHPQSSPRPAGTRQTLQVSGIRHVINVLEAIENGHVNDYRLIELYACDQGCFGTPVWVEDPFMAQPRFEWAKELHPILVANGRAGAVRRVEPLAPRAGLRLDSDMRAAMQKLAQIDQLTRAFPGRDCSVCGAPSCTALAEDVVLGRATPDLCIYRSRPSQPPASDP